MNELLYLSYGDDKYHLETMFSILTAKKFENLSNNYSIVVYTDSPQSYEWLNVETQYVSPDTINGWVGDIGGYPFRRKIKCVIDRLSKLEGKLVFVDGDTYFKKNPKAVFDRINLAQFCLHIPEIRLTRRDGTAGNSLHTVFDRRVISWSDGTPMSIGTREVMWNSGVIGVHSENLDAIKWSLNLIDELWNYERSIHTLEQFALGHVFNKYGKISRTDDIVFHYWHKRQRLPFIARLPTLISRAKDMPLADAADWAYSHRPTEPVHRKAAGVLREILHKAGFNRRWTRASY